MTSNDEYLAKKDAEGRLWNWTTLTNTWDKAEDGRLTLKGWERAAEYMTQDVAVRKETLIRAEKLLADTKAVYAQRCCDEAEQVWTDAIGSAEERGIPKEQLLAATKENQ